MNREFIDLSEKINTPYMLDAFMGVHKCADYLGIPYLIVGASARDLVMHHAFGAKIQRATMDIDFAVQVPSWEAFESLRNQLANENFKQSKVPHRLFAPNGGTPIDIVPFGGVADDQSIIKMPPNEFPMNVLGFQEALENSYSIKLSTELTVRVASPEGMMLLKFIAWTDRDADKRGKDAADIGYLLNTYEEIGHVQDSFYDSEELIDMFGGNLTEASVYLLGQRVKAIASEGSALVLNGVFTSTNPKLNIDVFVHEMNRGFQNRHGETLLKIFINGYNKT